MKQLKIISRIVIGIVFMFSGIVKAIDPLGSAYKFHDYFHAFNIGFLDKLSLPLAVLLCTAEFLAGFSVLTGINPKVGRTVVLILLSVFTPTTLILALTNPVSDCGCFGDAVHLTNWQTFGKNIILVFLLIILFRPANENLKKIPAKTEWLIISVASILFIAFCLMNLRYLPVIDFLPYTTGTKIVDKMTIPEGVAPDKYSTTFIYEKDGTRKEFSIENYPANDSSWKFVDQKSVLIKKGYVPPIHDFQITSSQGEDITQKILSFQGYSLLMISKKLAEANTRSLNKGFNLGNYCVTNGINFYILTSSGTKEAGNYSNGLTFCSVDETTLKTMMRANPGYILLKDGVIIEKWSWANVPEEDWFGKLKGI